MRELVFDGLGEDQITWYEDPKGRVVHVKRGARVAASEVTNNPDGFVTRGQAHYEGEDDGTSATLSRVHSVLTAAAAELTKAAGSLEGQDAAGMAAMSKAFSASAQVVKDQQTAHVALHRAEQERLRKEAEADAQPEDQPTGESDPTPEPEL